MEEILESAEYPQSIQKWIFRNGIQKWVGIWLDVCWRGSTFLEQRDSGVKEYPTSVGDTAKFREPNAYVSAEEGMDQ